MLHRTLATCWVTLAVAHLFCISGRAASRIPLPEHPRPDFERADWLNLNGTWRFDFDAEDVGQREGWSAGKTILGGVG